MPRGGVHINMPTVHNLHGTRLELGENELEHAQAHASRSCAATATAAAAGAAAAVMLDEGFLAGVGAGSTWSIFCGSGGDVGRRWWWRPGWDFF